MNETPKKQFQKINIKGAGAIALMALLMTTAVAGVTSPVTEPTLMNVGFYSSPDVSVGDDYYGATVLSVNDAVNFISVEVTDPLFVERVQLDSDVRYVAHDSIDAVTTQYTPNDQHYGLQYGITNTNTDHAWDVTLGSTAVTVAVLDTGIQASHPDFESSRLLNGITYAGGNQNNDGDGHGTHVSGTVGATINNGIGVAGVSQSMIMPVKVLSDTGSGAFSWIANGITYAADNGAHILSLSLGCAAGCYDQGTVDAIDYARYTKGAMVVVASGNDYGAVGFPGNHPTSFTVACTDSNNNKCNFSNTGNTVDISAPGFDIASTYIGSSYVYMSGTSMSTPHVSGIAALIKTANPGYSASDLENAITSTAISIGGSGMGAGLVDTQAAIGGGTPPTNNAPTASFSFTTNELTVNVDGTGSSDPDGDPLTYSWNWGDGSPDASGSTASHTYSADGTYSVTLTVTDTGSLSDSVTQSVTVSATPPPPGGTVHISAMSSSWAHQGKNHIGTCTATVVDANNVAISGATVSLDWQAPRNSGTSAGISDSSGDATSSWQANKRNHGGWTCTVTDVVVAGFTYDAGANVVSSQSFTVS